MDCLELQRGQEILRRNKQKYIKEKKKGSAYKNLCVMAKKREDNRFRCIEVVKYKNQLWKY